LDGAISVSLLKDDGSAMPAFTFEKIPPPARRKAAAPAANEKPRRVVTRMLERFVEIRVRRKLNSDTDVGERREPSHDDI
jgi:hypothetical protein